ncbi:MAG: dipicolinate synthase subunit B [Clostridia bacterium]|nr:dipicolinate synthase subunit B [Clostridia bacterium]
MPPKLGFALTGSFCTLRPALSAMETLARDWEITPLLSETVQSTDTRFGPAAFWREEAARLCGRAPMLTIPDAEPIGPKGLFDLLLICPCTGNTLSKLARGITDGCVTMAVKSHRRRGGTVLVALSTNDALSGSAPALGTLLDRKGFFFVPLYQDDPANKPNSLKYREDALIPALGAALAGRQLPLFA